MTENSKKVLEYLKQAGVGVAFTTKEVQEALGFETSGSVTGSVNGLVRKGRAERFTETSTDPETGKVVKINKFSLTEAGMNFDPDASEE